MKYAFYPGCSLESTAWDYDRSTRAVCNALGIDLEEIPDWACCGSTPGHCTNRSLAVALPVLSLQKAEQMGAPVVTACASCYARLRTANHEVRAEDDERERVERITGHAYDGGVDVVHVLDLLVNRIAVERIAELVTRPLHGLKVACYYGCLLSRPPAVVAFDDPENPTCMERLVAALGAQPVEWPYRTECCGAGLSITHTDVVCRLSHRILSMAKRAGADCVAVACPMCQTNLDLRQGDATRAHGELPEIPVPYLTQLVGLALSLAPEELGLDALFVSPRTVLENVTGLEPAEERHGAE